MSSRTVSVAVPVAVDRGFTYLVPDDWPDAPGPGSRVLVPFGTRSLVGVVRPVEADLTEQDVKIRPLHTAFESTASLPQDVVELCEWVSDYYVAPVGEVYRLALPGLLSNADARVVGLTEAGRTALQAAGPLMGGVELDGPSRRLLERVAESPGARIAVARLARTKPRIPAAFKRLGELESQGLVGTAWDDESSAGRTETHLRRTDVLRGGAADEAQLQKVVGRSKQRRAVLDYLESRPSDDEDGWVALSELRGPFPRVRQLIGPLIEADLVVTQERPKELDPFETGAIETTQPQSPTADQAAALEALREALQRGRYHSAALHGITGSGKTEVYLQLIADALDAGRSAIVLVPEIALTPQLADRFRARFGERVAVLHSGLTPRQRLDAWQQIRQGERPIVIGARSAVFAPVPRLSVIVVDEEHDPSFKQEEGVRYNARDVALVRGRNADALVVLGSATPSLETYDLATKGRHEYLAMTTRPTPRPLPKVDIVPLSVHRADPHSLMTGILRNAILDTVAAKEQAIIFLNRRGYTTNLVCEACGSLQQCPDCSAPSMTYHLSRNRLMCHLCGHIEATPEQCRSCGSSELTHGGVGTERVEVAMERELEGVRVLRLDRDAARGRQLLDTLARFRRREADVLVGTQMLSKGHDFPGVTLVGILQGDHGLALPDPRAGERTFQLLTQVAGRAGRGDRPGRVLVQAYAVEHPAIVHAAKHDYEGFATVELEQRKTLGNPPHGHLALVRVHGLETPRVEARAQSLGRFLSRGVKALEKDHRGLTVRLLGPVPSPIAKINRRIRMQLLLRATQRGALRWLLQHLRPHLGVEGSGGAQTVALVDVDPQSLL